MRAISQTTMMLLMMSEWATVAIGGREWRVAPAPRAALTCRRNLENSRFFLLQKSTLVLVLEMRLWLW
jgi:hypothetical protein